MNCLVMLGGGGGGGHSDGLEGFSKIQPSFFSLLFYDTNSIIIYHDRIDDINFGFFTLSALYYYKILPV